MALYFEVQLDYGVSRIHMVVLQCSDTPDLLPNLAEQEFDS